MAGLDPADARFLQTLAASVDWNYQGSPYD